MTPKTMRVIAAVLALIYITLTLLRLGKIITWYTSGVGLVIMLLVLTLLLLAARKGAKG